MSSEERTYNPATNREWSSEVYQKAKAVIEEKLSAASSAVQSRSILEAVNQRYPSLCNDSIKDPWNPQLPYWIHRVHSAIQSLKKERRFIRLIMAGYGRE